jgi:hypothetical protein
MRFPKTPLLFAKNPMSKDSDYHGDGREAPKELLDTMAGTRWGRKGLLGWLVPAGKQPHLQFEMLPNQPASQQATHCTPCLLQFQQSEKLEFDE